MSVRGLVAVAAIVSVLTGGCRQDTGEQTAGAPGNAVTRQAVPAATAAVSVCVSIPPQAYVVKQIGGERVSVEVLVEPGQSPATYDPTPAQMAALDDADVYFRIGVPFEDALMARISASMPDLHVVDLRQGIELLPISGHGEQAGGSEHASMDPHTWLDPRLVATQAETIRSQLARLDPDGAATYSMNLEALGAELAHLDMQVAELLAPVKGRRMFVLHPAFGYFAAAYGLEQVAIEVEGRGPGPRELQQIIELARSQGLRTIFVQREFSDASAQAVAAETDAEVVRLDPLARDYITNLRSMARAIRDGLLQPGEGT